MRRCVIFLSLALLGCSDSPGAQVAATPQACFEELIASIRARDLAAYKQCWSKHARPGESMIERLEVDDGTLWSELQAVFRGPQTLTERQRVEIDGREHYKGKVEAPDAEGGGVGTLMMVRDDDRWRMFSW